MTISLTVEDIRTSESLKAGKTEYVLVLRLAPTPDNPHMQGLLQIASAAPFTGLTLNQVVPFVVPGIA